MLRAAQGGAFAAFLISLIAVAWTAFRITDALRLPVVYPMRDSTACGIAILSGAILATCANKFELAKSWAMAAIVLGSISLVSLATRWSMSDPSLVSLPRPLADLYMALPNALSILVGGAAVRGLARDNPSTYRIIFASLAGVVSATVAFCGLINGLFHLSPANPAFEAEIAIDATFSITMLGIAVLIIALQRRSEFGERIDFLLPLSVAVLGAFGSFLMWRFLLEERNTAVESQTMYTTVAAQRAIDSEVVQRLQQLRYTADQPDPTEFRAIGLPEAKGDIRWLDSRRLPAADRYLRPALPADTAEPQLDLVANPQGVRQAVFSAPKQDGGRRLAVIPLADFLDPVLRNLLAPDFNLLLVQAGESIYHFPPSASRLQSSPRQAVVSALPLKSEIRVEPRFEFVRRGGTASLHVALAMGLIASFLLGYSVFLLSTARSRLTAVLEARAVLQAEVEQRRKTEAELDRKAKQLEASNAQLQEFAHVVSHDLQEPLRTINGFAELLHRRYLDQLDADGQEFLAFITDSSQRMSAMVSGLLAYSRLTYADDPEEMVDLGEAVEWAKANLVMAIAESEAAIEYANLPTVRGYRLQLCQLFQNLIGNALKYRGDSAPVIRITAEESGPNYTITVADNGAGISPESQERIFGLFKRAHGSGYPGAGVGLALCKKIVERHGGTIWVESVVGQGSKFHVRLPKP